MCGIAYMPTTVHLVLVHTFQKMHRINRNIRKEPGTMDVTPFNSEKMKVGCRKTSFVVLNEKSVLL